MRLNAQQLRRLDEEQKIVPIKRNPLYLILDNVYDTYNVGGLFRLADALAMTKIYLCGVTETPPNSKIQKASIGTYKIMPWEYKTTAVEAIKDVRKVKSATHTHRSTIIAVEQHPKALPYDQITYQLPLALVVGNETTGILQETLHSVDMIVEIPMFGINKSLNVIVSAAIITYHIQSTAPKKSD